jgi:hypothetical protein
MAHWLRLLLWIAGTIGFCIGWWQLAKWSEKKLDEEWEDEKKEINE